jgi:hypothetical protein
MQMEDNYGEPDFNITATPAESNHPVLQQLKDRIAELEAQVENKNSLLTASQDATRNIRNEKWQYEGRVKTVLVEALEDHDEDTVKYIAEQLDIELTKTKQVEVNVTFTIDLEYEIGSEPDPEWDFEFEVTHDSITDFQTDIIWNKDA